MRLYLAARYTRKQEIARYAALLTGHGFYITSTWFDEPHNATVQLADVKGDELATYAARDLSEIDEADALLLFSESDQTFNRRGGRHVEFGYALAKGKRIFVVGPRENIFHHIAGVTHYASIETFAFRNQPMRRG